MGKTFLTQLHLTLYYSVKRKECYFGIPDFKETSANIEDEDDLHQQNMKMIDEVNSKDDGKLLPSGHMIAEPITTRMKPSMVNQNSISNNRTLSSLTGKLDIVTSPDRTVNRTKLRPARKKDSTDEKKGFSSITITSRRFITSSCHTPKEITGDPVSSLCRSNDLLMKAPVSSVEHNQRCRFLDNGVDCSQNFKPFGSINSQELPCQPNQVSNMDSNHLYLKDITKKIDYTTFISGIHVKRDQAFPKTIYYRHKLLSLSLDQCHAANQRTYKSEISFRIKQPPKCRLDHKYNRYSVETPRPVIRNQVAGEHKKNSPVNSEQSNLGSKTQHRILKDHPRNQEQVNGFHHDPCQDVSSYLNIKDAWNMKNVKKWMIIESSLAKQIMEMVTAEEEEECVELDQRQWPVHLPHYTAFDFPQTLKKDPLPVSEIYAERGSPLQSFGHLGAERSSVTTFNNIFGKQISNQGKNKLNLQKENIPRKGYKWSKSCGNIGKNDKENLRLPELAENKPDSKACHEEMSLQEALEHHRPDFICNSQERVHKLELMAHERKIQKKDPKSPFQKHPSKSINQKRKIFTVPHPLSDNLFKPQERTISKMEMQQRSKRLYNRLPEVKKKKEEEERRMVAQVNRIRALVYKRKILDRILHRTLD